MSIVANTNKTATRLAALYCGALLFNWEKGTEQLDQDKLKKAMSSTRDFNKQEKPMSKSQIKAEDKQNQPAETKLTKAQLEKEKEYLEMFLDITQRVILDDKIKIKEAQEAIQKHRESIKSFKADIEKYKATLATIAGQLEAYTDSSSEAPSKPESDKTEAQAVSQPAYHPASIKGKIREIAEKGFTAQSYHVLTEDGEIILRRGFNGTISIQRKETNKGRIAIGNLHQVEKGANGLCHVHLSREWQRNVDIFLNAIGNEYKAEEEQVDF